ncbi:MAG: DUF2953 domain-containing protein [Dehalococcoidales bacterium]|nr:DUF2953 domain-containing protein [Dehalococcoidales bacterium]
MWWIPVLGGLAGICLFLLCIPVEVRMIVDTSSDKPVRVRGSWLFGLVKKDISGRRPSGKPKTQAKPGRYSPDSLTGIFERISNISRRAAGLIRDVYRQVSFGNIQGAFEIGIDDPAETGMVFAVLGPVNAMLNTLPGYNVSLVPSFDGTDKLEGNLSGKASIMPVRLIFPLLRFGLSPEILRAGKDMAARKLRRKKTLNRITR